MVGTVQDVLAVARRNIGFIEGRNNQNPYAPLVGHANHQPWCASFVAAVFQRAGVPLPNTSAYTPTMAGGFKAAGLWRSRGKAGDVVFFRWPALGRIAHVGIVEEVLAPGVYRCIEGNTDSAGGRTGGRVMRQVRRANIAGFGRPVYAAPAVPDTRSPRLAQGSRLKLKVRDFQNALVLGGFLVPNLHEDYGDIVDGEFGPRTVEAVRKLQAKHKLKVTGEVGPLEWAAARTYTGT